MPDEMSKYRSLGFAPMIVPGGPSSKNHAGLEYAGPGVPEAPAGPCGPATVTTAAVGGGTTVTCTHGLGVATCTATTSPGLMTKLAVMALEPANQQRYLQLALVEDSSPSGAGFHLIADGV